MTTFRAGALTDTGRARAVNQDSLLVVDGRLYAVADGMGGHRGGEVASALALESLAGNLDEPTTQALVAGVTSANSAVYRRSAEDPELRGMGTTLIAMALIVDAEGHERLAMANVGDSRAYRLRDGVLEQITEDHSLVESLVRQGRITPEEAATHPQRNIITRALGVDPQVEVDSWELPAVPGDRFLLCSDGLFNEVESDVITAILGRLEDPDAAVAELVRLANEGGGRDNITCVVVDVLDGPGTADQADARVATASEPDLAGYGPATEPTPAVSVFDEPSAGAAPATPAPPEAPPPPAPPPPLPPPGPPADTGDEATDAVPAPYGALPDHLPDDEADAAPAPRRPRRFTWRVVVFVVALLALAGAVVAALVYYGRSTYYVAFDADEQVVIFKGQPGGFLVFDPTVERETGITRADLRETAADRVAEQPDQATLSDAEAFIDNLCDALSSGATPTECADAATGGTQGTTPTTAAHSSTASTKPDP
ncbi:MAG TPA: Stp1/IreP family PP2C-type Ser/Thr phosphatase [Acidimicrobiales bacterium]|nr:Stp1/IreP family PP2C-type Ser/Thr phosphatase [Acidimicrobiales bacterium]